MVKLINIIKEGRIHLTLDETHQIEEIIPEIIDIIEGEWIENNYKEVGQLNYESADKTPGSVKVYVGNDSSNATGYFQTNDPKNPKDNAIVIQQGYFANKYFTNIGGLINKTHKFLTGDENAGVEELRKTLKHELIHAKDPAINQYKSEWSIKKEGNDWIAIYKSGDGKRTKSFKFKSEDEAKAWVRKKQLQSYNPNNTQNYYKSWAEFQTMTGQFFEAIVGGINRLDIRNSTENIKKIEIALSEILSFFSGKPTEFSQETYDFIQDTKSRNLFQRLIKNTENFIVKSGFTLGNKPTESALDVYINYIDQIKQYNPEGYKEFLKDLYKLIDIVKNQINQYLSKNKIQYQVKIKEMQDINEVKRFQKLAGIKEEKGYYLTPTNDPKTAQVHFTTDEKPSLSKNYEPLSPKSQRKDKLTPQSIEKTLISILRDNKMDYEKSITIVSDKLNIGKEKLKHDFPKNDMIYKAGSIDEIVNEALENYRNNQIEEGVGDFLKKAALGAALAFGSPEKSMAQTPQQIEKTAFDSTFNIVNMDDEKAGETLVLSYQENPFTADMWSKLSGSNGKLFRSVKLISDQAREREIQPEEIAALGRMYKKTVSAAEFLDRANALKTAKLRGIDEVVNEVLAKVRKSNKK